MAEEKTREEKEYGLRAALREFSGESWQSVSRTVKGQFLNAKIEAHTLKLHCTDGTEEKAIEGLVEIGRPALPLLEKELGGIFDEAAINAARAIERIAPERKLSAWVRLLSRHPEGVYGDSKEGRAIDNIVWNVSQCGKEAVPEMINFIGSERTPYRNRGKKVLEQIGKPALPAVRKALLEVHGAIEGLSGERLEKLRELLKEKNPEKIIEEAKGGLGEGEMEFLRRMLLKGAAIEVIMEANDAGSVKALAQVANDSNEEPRTRWHACSGLETLKGPAAFSALMAALSDPIMRSRAAYELGEFGNRRAVPALIRMLGDDDAEVRKDAAGALGKLGDRHAVPALIFALTDVDEYTRLQAAQALGKIGDARAKPHITDAVKYWRSVKYASREFAIEAAGLLGCTGAIPDMREVFAAEDGRCAMDAAVALGRLKDYESFEAMEARFRDGHGAQAIVRALGELGDARAIPLLSEVLADKEKYSDSYTRRGAAEALGKIGTLECVDALIAALGDQEQHRYSGAGASNAAKDALAGIGVIAVPKLLAALEKQENEGEIRSALTGMGLPAVPHIAGFLEGNANAEAKASAIFVLGNISKQDSNKGWADVFEAARIVPILVALAGKLAGSDGIAALEVLSGMGDARAMPLFVSSLRSSNDRIIRCSLDGLREIGAAAVPALEAALREPALVAKRREITDALGNARKKGSGNQGIAPADGLLPENLGLKHSLVRQRRLAQSPGQQVKLPSNVARRIPKLQGA